MSYVHQVLIQSLSLYQKEGKGKSIDGDKKEGRVTVEEIGIGTAAAGRETDTRETALAKASHRSQSAGRNGRAAGLHLSPHPISSLSGKDAHLPCVPALPLPVRLAGRPGRRGLEGSLQTSGMFSHCRAPPRCLSCS